MKKYEVIEDDNIRMYSEDENLTYDFTLSRIRALTDIPMHNVKKGDLGGYIESESNLSHEGSAWVANEAKVYGEAQVFENALVKDNAEIFGGSKVYGNAKVNNTAEVSNGAKVFGNAEISGDAKVIFGAEVYGNAH